MSAEVVRLEDRRQTLPHSAVAEQGVLGALFLDDSAIGRISDLVAADDFYAEKHQHIFTAIMALSAAHHPIDMITIAAALETRGQLDAVGGSTYLAALLDATPTTAHVEHHARIVAEKSSVRRAIYRAQEVVASGMGDHGDVGSYLDGAEHGFAALASEHAIHGDRPKMIGELAVSVFEALGRQEDQGVTTGYSSIDGILGGWKPGRLYCVAGRPSMGKSALAGDSVRRSCLEGSRVLWVSLEMGADECIGRWLSQDSGIPLPTIGHVDCGPTVYDSVMRFFELPLAIWDPPGATIADIAARARQHQMRRGLDVLVVDYLQLVTPGKADNREQEVGQMSRSLKALARELGIAVVMISQLNRKCEERTDKRPMMSDLRDSGQIEQDCDVVAFVYRDEVYNSESPDRGIAEVIVRKQRGGGIGTARLRFVGERTAFFDLTRQDDPR